MLTIGASRVVRSRAGDRGAEGSLAFARAIAWIVLTLIACSHDDAKGVPERLLDPKECERCHPTHYRQWLGSMHAYASEDPVFLAMNARGQRETGGALGDFCVRCHAPIALALGETKDGTNLDEVPPEHKGVTCYFCHSVEDVDGTHNNPLVLANDGVMRGEYPDAVENDFHESAYSPIHDGLTVASGAMCGSCHDITNGHGVAIERTFAEWRGSFYSTPSENDPILLEYFAVSCIDCHMPGTASVPIADYPGVGARRSRRSHRMPGIDVALTDFPDAELGPELVADQLEELVPFLDPNVCVGLCVRPDAAGDGTDVVVWLHNEFSGHAFPSGAAQDRRMWVELTADAAAQRVLESGVVAEGQSVDAAAGTDPTLWLFRDFAYGADDEPASMFWSITRVESNTLQVPADAGLKYDRTTWAVRTWHVDGPVDRADVAVKIRPIPMELFDELAADGLDPAIAARVPTHVLANTVLRWTPESAQTTDLEGPCVKSATCFDAISMDVDK